MKDLKDYLKNIEPLSSYIKKHMGSVYTEEKRPRNKVRIWLSYDVAEGYEEIYDKLYAVFDGLKAESWGNSVATYLQEIEEVPSNEMIARQVVHYLYLAGIIKEDNFDDEKWKETKGLSIYVFYRFQFEEEKEGAKPNLNSNHFVLLHNAPMKHLDGWKSK